MTVSATSRGITERLDHLQWLGIRGVWLSPVTVSPNADFGYDVADFYAVDPSLGTMSDLDDARRPRPRRAASRSCSTSSRTTRASSTRGSGSRGRHATTRSATGTSGRIPKPDGSPPNNWVSSFGGSAWTLDDATGQYYLQNFLPEQADLNWWSDEVRDEFDRILRFWFDKGVAGFRIDVAHMVIKDRELRDNPPATDDDPILDQMRGQLQVYNSLPARGARRAPAPARGRRLLRPAASARRRDVRRATRGPHPVLRHRRRAQPRVQHPVPAHAARGRRAAGDDRAHRGADAATAAPRCGPRATTTSSASRPAGPTTTRTAPGAR